MKKISNVEKRIFQQFIQSCLSTLLYGSETWELDQKLQLVLNSFETIFYRHILGIIPLYKVTNKSIYEKVKQEPFSVKLAKRQLTWVGHLLRRKNDDPIRINGFYEPSEQMGKSKQGRYKTNYKQH